MYKKITTLSALALLTGSMAFSNTPLLTNTTFDGYPAEAAFEGWIFGANRFKPADTWIEFVQAPDSYAFDDRLAPEGDGWVFTNWDDQDADRIETYMFHEFGAGPAGGATPNELFETDDTIVFKGKVSATKTRTDVVARAFIKFLGYNDLGWEFQLKEVESRFFNATETLSDFELRTTFPDLALDDSFQVVQIGFEVTGEWNGSSFGMGELYFQDIEAFIEGGSEPVLWNGYEVDENGWAQTGNWMGTVNVTHDPWIWVVKTEKYLYIPADGGGWAFVPAP
ncbi:MAG: hypothetical protein ACP5I4_03120 [Oceanipulchritudo sp.]